MAGIIAAGDLDQIRDLHVPTIGGIHRRPLHGPRQEDRRGADREPDASHGEQSNRPCRPRDGGIAADPFHNGPGLQALHGSSLFRAATLKELPQDSLKMYVLLAWKGDRAEQSVSRQRCVVDDQGDNGLFGSRLLTRSLTSTLVSAAAMWLSRRKRCEGENSCPIRPCGDCSSWHRWCCC